jgi:hypothetical protein
LTGANRHYILKKYLWKKNAAASNLKILYEENIFLFIRRRGCRHHRNKYLFAKESFSTAQATKNGFKNSATATPSAQTSKN